MRPKAPDLATGKLPDPLPADPLPLLIAWFDEANRNAACPNPNAVALATATPNGLPSVRMVLCKAIEPLHGSALFFTNYTSRKAAELEANPHAAAVFHWDHAARQARLEGVVTRTSEAESDAYFASRPLLSQLGAWASQQSQPIDARFKLLDRLGSVMARFGVGTLDDPSVRVPRPSHWGGYRLWLTSVELWMGADYRLHDRATWSRSLVPHPDAVTQGEPVPFHPSAWTATRRQP